MDDSPNRMISHSHIASFAPIIAEHARILILGSIPSVLSLEKNQYYGNPQNAFWWIMGKILSVDLVAMDYASGIAILQQNGICLWDTLASCERAGSLDSSIKNNTIIANDISALLEANSQITLIAFNGQKSAQTFARHVQSKLLKPYECKTLPSSSPAHASMSREEKLATWRGIIQPHLPMSP